MVGKVHPIWSISQSRLGLVAPNLGRFVLAEYSFIGCNSGQAVRPEGLRIMGDMK